MAIILGINAMHADSAACLVIDGILKAAVAEERLGERLKHSPKFPINAIRYVLQSNGVRIKDLTHVAIARNPQANYAAKMAYTLAHPIKAAGAVLEHFRRNTKTGDLISHLADGCGEESGNVRFETVHVEHHLAHIASAYYVSPFEGTTAGFSYDASGDFVSTMAAKCEGYQIEILDRVTLPHSLGFYYTALCQFIGFDDFGEEYKVMGLSAYGEDAFADVMKDLVRLEKDRWFEINQRYFGMHEGGESGAVDNAQRLVMGRFYTDALIDRLGAPRKRNDELTKREKDLAKSTQVRFEDAAIHCLHRLHALVSTPRIAMAGGCALNGVANARILRDTPFKESYIHAAASDDGTCVGAAFYVWHAVLKNNARFHMNHAYWGPEYPDADVRQAANTSGLAVRRLGEAELLDEVSQLLSEGKIVGWYQGRSEWGPRALGNRSILANPSTANMKDTINVKIKRRESFRPFAPSVLKEYVSTYFEQMVESPFMMHVVKIKPEWRTRIPAVTHVDGTGRLQTVDRGDNPKYYDLIEAFRRKTGIGMLLNTSFNENEPIVDRPEQAIACFKRTDMDALCLGNYLLKK